MFRFVSEALPGKEKVTFFQMDRRIVPLLDQQLAVEIPLLQEPGKRG